MNTPLPNQGTFPPDPVYQPTITTNTSAGPAPEEVKTPGVAAVTAGSPLGDFRLKDATHAGIFKLANGAELALAKNAEGAWALAGTVSGKTQTIAFTPEACALILGAMLRHRDQTKPVLHVELIAMANNSVSQPVGTNSTKETK